MILNASVSCSLRQGYSLAASRLAGEGWSVEVASGDVKAAYNFGRLRVEAVRTSDKANNADTFTHRVMHSKK